MRVVEPTARQWTRDEYYKAAEMGWFDGQRVELIDGEVLVMPVFNPPHLAASKRVEWALEDAFGANFHTRVAGPLSLGQNSDPEPDLALVPGHPDDYLTAHPTTALLVVEISESTLKYDQRDKGSLYASAGLQEYWIVNLIDRWLEVYRRPIPDATEPHGWVYDEVRIFGLSDVVAPLALPQAKIPVVDLIP